MLRYLCTLLVLTTVAVADQSVTNGDITVNFQGQSGWITVSRADGTNMQVGFDKIYELDNKGNVVGQSKPMSTETFVWGTPTSVVIGGHNASLITFDGTLSSAGGASLHVDAYFFEVDSTMTVNNQTVTVAKNHVKFSLKLSHYTFGAPTNGLRFGFQVKFKGGSKGWPTDMNKTPQGGTVVLGGGTIDVVNTAVVDGTTTSVTPNIVTGPGIFTGLTIDFPHFNNYVWYDPTFGLGASSALSSAAPALSMLLFVVLAPLFASH